MLRNHRMPAAALAALSLLTVACGGGAGKADDTAREIRNEELARMVLDVHQFGPEFGAFNPEGANGIVALEDLANDDNNPAAERADLEQAGFTTGYRTLYESPQPTGERATTVGSSVLLFESADGAARYLEDTKAEMRADESDEDPASIFEWSELDVGDENVSLRVDGSLEIGKGSSVPFSGTVIYVRHGRIIAGLSLYGFPLPDSEKERLHANMEGAASVINDRIASVLATVSAPAAATQ